MPGKIKVKILAGRNLPVMDRSGDTTDAYVEIKFGNTTYKTDVCRKSLNPQWNSEWYRFEVDDAELQDEPLQVRLMDHDTYSANDAIGKVYVNLNPLLLPGSPLAVKNIWTLEATMNSSGGAQGGAVMSGWIPVFDTMHGIRGEVNIIVKVELFSDCNKFRQSSCGVQFFYSPNIPHGYHAQVIHGFVEELVVSDDPEYKWIDKIRTPRASNEARQTLFLKMSGEVQRKIGLKALDLGGNAVIGYVQNFDLEGESGIVARGIGTAVTLVKLQDITTSLPIETSNIEDLTCFGLQSKGPLDFSESDDSLPLLANSPNQSPVAPCSPINIRPTTMSQRFPKYEKSPKHQRRATARIAEYRATSLRGRQFSLQSSAVINGAPVRKAIGSSLSLAEDLISETSLRNMLALEDMRGEPAGNPFSRGLKNFRYLHQNILPKRVAQIKSRFADSLDDESDPESNYSSTWSLAGSESNRSSIVDLRQSIRRKKFTHKKMPPSDGIAALLIRSVHAGFPLDSVKEDRETPAPSPVNFLCDTAEYVGDRSPTDNDDDTDNPNVDTSKCQEASAMLEDEIVTTKEELEPKYTSDRSIPMMSSSESDTSSSDEDEPSESSTNYNILDETYSLIDPQSPDERKYSRAFSKASKSSDVSSSSVASPIKIIKQSFESKDIAEIVPVREEDLQARQDRSLESSTDYNILDETSSLLESKFPGDPRNRSDLQTIDVDRAAIVETLGLFETPEKVETRTDLAMEDEFTAIALDYLSECNTDYNFLDDTQSLIDPGNLDDETPIGFHRKVEDENFPQVSARAELPLSSYMAKDQRSLDFATSSVDLYSPVDSPFCESVTEVVDEARLISPASSTEMDEPTGATASLTGQPPRVPSPPDDKLDSSTDYNILDDTCSLTERSSFGDENAKADYPETFHTANLAASLNIGELILPLCLREIDVASGTIGDSKAASERHSSCDSQADRNLNSSTDYNVLEDTTSLNEASSLDETKLGSIPQSVENADRPKLIAELTLPSALDGIDSLPGVGGESPSRNNFVAPFSTTTSISNDEKDAELSTSTSSSSSRNPQSPVRLKFLPKQKHFDSADDLDFVTSTPVETDVTPPDFSPIEKSPESPEYKKWDFPSIPGSPNSRIGLFDRDGASDGTSHDRITPSTFIVGEKIFDNKGKPICPLGVPVDRVTTVSDIRAANGAKASRDSKTTVDAKMKNDSKIGSSVTEAALRENEHSSGVPGPSVRNEVTPPPLRKTSKKVQKKVERTDTVIYKGPMKDREKTTMRSATVTRDTVGKTAKKIGTSSSPIPIIVAPPPEEHTTRLQVPVIQTTSINVHSTHSPDEMKTQRFGSVAAHKCQPDEFQLSEKFNRKYRQHCILDLIKTIDTKMMHHAHHERRDSTKSRQRRKRERMNASATPSPDSIHRTKSHRRRSRSRSPDRQHVHSKVSPLSTHSFPVKTTSSSNLICDPPPLDSSCENITKDEAAISPALCKDPPNGPLVGDNPTTPNDDPSSLNAELTDFDVTLNNPPDAPLTSDNLANVDEKTIVPVINEMCAKLLLPKDTEHPVFKSHSAGSLDKFGQRSSSPVTKITNTPNITDDLCVPCLQLTHRQQDEQPSSPLPASSVLPSSLGSKATPNAMPTKNNSTAVPNMHRRSSDSDLSITPKGNSLAGSDRSMGGHLRPSTAIVRTMNQDTMEMLEYPFITMQQYPPGFVLNIGGLVSARSVKLLERITNLEEPEGRDAWWTEIRMEVRSHARALACNVVLGYKEEISICDDVCVLNASGTAAVINLLNASQDQDNVILSRTIMTTSVESERDKTQVKSSLVKADKIEETVQPGQQQSQQQHLGGKLKRTSESNDHEVPYMPTVSACSLCHLPYSEASVPFRVDVSKCSICNRAKVPDVLFTTIELPDNIPMTGRGVFLQATVCKCKRDLRGELNAKEISDCLPFLEYELHSLLLNKLKVKGMNAIFGLKVQVSVGERLVIGMAVGTAVYLTALPTPSVPQIASGNSWHNEEQLAEIQKNLIETVKKNREFYRLKPIVDIENGRAMATSDTDESDDDLPDLDLGIGTKDACVLEVDDVEDMDRINLLMDEKPPDDFHVVNTQSIPGLEDLEIVRNLQMFTQISRAKIPAGQFASMPSKYFARMLQTVLFKLRRMVPCALCDMQFRVALPEQDEIQLSVVGMALGLGEPTRFSKYKRKIIPNSTSKDPIKKTDEADLIFSLDEDQVDVGPQETAINPSNTNISNSSPLTGVANQKHRPRSPFRSKSHMQHRHKHVPLKERYGVDITPLSYLPGGKIERYLGNLNFFFIRESTSIRENGGLSGFTHSFVTEVLAIVRAHITALGGNAMVAFFMTQCVLLHSPHKNQGQCLINVGGDVVTVSYYGDEKYQGNQNC